MRYSRPGLKSLVLGALLSVTSVPLSAQDTTATPPTGEDPVAVEEDALEETEPYAEDSVLALRPRVPRGENPYLREVRDSVHAAPRRGPYYATLGLGLGSESVAAPVAGALYSESRMAPTLTISVGATLNQNLRLGLEGMSWLNLTASGALETVSAFMVGGRVYPISNGGLYLQSAAGLGHYALGDDALFGGCGCSPPIAEDFGFAWMLGGGIEVPVSRGLWLGPNLMVLRMNVPGADGYRDRVLHFGMSITYDGH